jgi:hypothetical protein
VVVFLLVVALKQQSSGWSCFVAFVFTVVVALLNIFFIFDMIALTLHWFGTKTRPIDDDDWTTMFACIDSIIVAILLLIGNRLIML